MLDTEPIFSLDCQSTTRDVFAEIHDGAFEADFGQKQTSPRSCMQVCTVVEQLTLSVIFYSAV